MSPTMHEALAEAEASLRDIYETALPRADEEGFSHVWAVAGDAMEVARAALGLSEYVNPSEGMPDGNGARIIQGLQEAVDVATGEDQPARVSVVGVEGADWVLVPTRADAAICRAIAKRMTDRPGAIPFDRLGSGPQTGLIGSAAFAWEDALSAAPPDPRKPGPAAGEIEKLEDGWLPNVLCPTDGEWRLHKLPDGAEVVAAFDGHAIGDRRWLIKSFGYHNPSRPNGQVVGGVERMTTAYDTFVVTSMPEGVFPTQFRPNDTVFGKPTPCRAAELAQGGGE